MRFLFSVIDSSSNSATGDEMEAIDAFNERLQSAGHWVLAAGVAAPGTAITVDNRGGAGLVADGPFVATDEYVAGFWIIEAPNPEAALALATDGSLACNRKVEIRAFLGN